MNRPLAILATVLLFVGCIPATQSTPYPDSLPTEIPDFETESTEWWNDAVFYEIFVRSYYDSNNDGNGDFNGITQKLSYIQSLGANAIWLMPIHPSPSYHGYDVTNYYAVNPQYGTMNDFKNLLNEAHRRGIKIIIDLVLNHTSSSHPFFSDANRDIASNYRDWFIWSNKPGKHFHPGSNDYYYGFFGSHMPDLNYRNRDVTSQMENVTRYWLADIGVDGFRLDAIKYLIEEGDRLENTASTHEWMHDYFNFYKSIDTHAYTIGEVWGAGAFLSTKYSQETDQIFNFELADGILTSAQTGSATYVNSALKLIEKEKPDFNFGTFLTNHDQSRVMTAFSGDVKKGKVAAFLMLTTPGTPFIYYGEEIGMQGQKPDEDIRRPMQWNSDINAGFTTGSPWRAVHQDYIQTNVATEWDEPDSLLNHYRSLIQVRENHPALRRGKVFMVETGNSGVYAILCMDEHEIVLVLANLENQSISDYGLTLKDSLLPDSSYRPESLFGNGPIQSVVVMQGEFKNYKPLNELPPYEMLIVQFRK